MRNPVENPEIAIESRIDISDKNPNEDKINSLLEGEHIVIKQKAENERREFDKYKGEKKDEIESFCNREFLNLPNKTFLTAFFDKELLGKSR